MLIGKACHTAAARGACQHAHLHQVGLADVLQRDALLTQGGGQGVQPYGAAAVHLDDGAQHTAVQLVQTQLVNVHPPAGGDGGLLVNGAVALHGGKVAHPLEQAVGDTRRAAGAARQLKRALLSDRHT